MIIAGLYLLSFLLGSVPFGFLVARAKGVDIRKVGSGNIGATNVIRAVGKPLGFLVFGLDVLKGAAFPLVARAVLPPDQFDIHGALIGLAAVLGHMFSPFLGFKGGKGVASGLGALLGSAWIVGTVGFGAFLAALLVCRYVSLASLAACVTVMAMAIATHQKPTFLAVFIVFPLVVAYKHIPNIKRILKGEEPKFSFRQTREPPA